MILGRHFVVFSQRVSLPVLGAEDPSQIGMAHEVDARQIENLAFVPKGRLPEAGNAGDLGQLSRGVIFPSRQG